MRPSTLLILVLTLILAPVVGCQSGPRMAGLNPFYRPELTSFETPAQRIEKIRLVAESSTRQDTPEQDAIVRELLATLPEERDPLIRQAVLETVAEFRTTLASRALLAGLSDDSPYVRELSCRLLATHKAAGAAEALAVRVQTDESFDVRVAAAKALGRNGATAQQLLPLLEDPNPAMQLAGVEAMRNATGRDFGGDVSAYIAMARGEEVPPATRDGRTEVASRLSDWVPFF